MLLHELDLEALPARPPRLRLLAAALLRHASQLLQALATRLAFTHPAPRAEPVLEYHAEAGAPEGALYVNGQLVGRVLGVTRL